MIFHPQGLMKIEGCFILPPNAVASAHACLDKAVIVADWQYNCKQAPVETVSVFRNAGFEQIGDYADAYSPMITASLLRKIMPAEGNYERAGWCKFEIHGLW